MNSEGFIFYLCVASAVVKRRNSGAKLKALNLTKVNQTYVEGLSSGRYERLKKGGTLAMSMKASKPEGSNGRSQLISSVLRT